MKLYIVAIATYSESDCCLESFKPLIAKSFKEAVKLVAKNVNSYVKGMGDEIFEYEIDKEQGTAYIVWEDGTTYDYQIFEEEMEI